MLTRRTVILCTREATYGTDPVMTGSNGLLAWDVDIDVKGEILERDVLRDTLTPMPHVIGMKDVTVSFKTELKGGGLSGTGAAAPEYDPLLHACALGTAEITGTSLVYEPKSAESNIGSASLKVYKDGNLHKIVGARGTFKTTFEAGQYGVLEWELSGKYTPVIADTIPDVGGLANVLPPIVYNSSFQIGGFSPVCSRAMIDLANDVVRRADLNASYGVDSFRIAARKPVIEFDVDAVVESSNPFWTDWAGDVIDTYSINLGTTAGNKVQFSGIFQYNSNKYGDADGVSQYECVAALCSSNADGEDDEMVLTFA